MPTENGGMPELLATLVQLLFLKTCSADNSLFRIFFLFYFFHTFNDWVWNSYLYSLEFA
jgi:hypothetical protein